MTITEWNYQSIGFDIKEQSNEGIYSIDNNLWNQHEEVYNLILNSSLADENKYQLLSPTNQGAFECIKSIVKENGAVLISVEISVFFAEQLGIDKSNILCSTKLIGYDVCDLNGFYSIFDMKVFDLENQKKTMTELHYYLLAQAANIKVPSHRPFVVLQLTEVEI